MIEQPPTTEPPWYRQFWPWFIILIPALTVVAGITTLLLAMQAPSGLVVDDYYKQGLAINQDLARTDRARELGIRARVSHDAQTGILTVELGSSAGKRPASLKLTLAHPTLPHRDRTLELLMGADGRYTATLGDLPQILWHVSITPPDDQWRIIGRMHLPGGPTVELP